MVIFLSLLPLPWAWDLVQVHMCTLDGRLGTYVAAVRGDGDVGEEGLGHVSHARCRAGVLVDDAEHLAVRFCLHLLGVWHFGNPVRKYCHAF